MNINKIKENKRWLIESRVKIGNIRREGEKIKVILGMKSKGRFLIELQIALKEGELLTRDIVRIALVKKNYTLMSVNDAIEKGLIWETSKRVRGYLDVCSEKYTELRIMRRGYDEYISYIDLGLKLREGSILEYIDYQYIVMKEDDSLVLWRYNNRYTNKEVKERVSRNERESQITSRELIKELNSSHVVLPTALKLLKGYRYKGYINIEKEIIKLRMLGYL